MCFFVGTLCAGRFGLGWAHDDIFVACHMIMHYSCIHTFHFLPFGIICWLVFFRFSLSLSLSLSDSLRIAPKCKTTLSRNLLRSRVSSSNSTPLSVKFVMIKPVKTFQRTSPNMAFIRNTTLSYQTFPILLFQLSYIGEVGNLFVRYPWVVPPWSYRSFTPICTVLIILYLVSSLLFEELV